MSPRIIQIAALVASVALFGGVAALTPRVNDVRREITQGGIAAESPVANAPPEYAFAVQALGAFRGLLTNIAFIRATEHKEKGRYFDAMELASWICKLQPRFPSVWEFNSWNMAWNISVTTYTPEERWNWVYNGVKLIRDEGLYFNPRAINLYKQIAWIFVNKMSETTDDHNVSYKKYWAWHMHLVFGPPPDPLREFDEGLEIKDFGELGEDPVAAAARKEMQRRLQEKREKKERGELLEHQEEPELRQAANKPGSFFGDAPTGESIEAARAGQEALTPFNIARQAAYDLITSIDQAPRTLADLYAKTPEARDVVAGLADMGVNINDKRLTEEEYFGEQLLSHAFFWRWRKLVDRGSTLRQVARDMPEDPDAANLEKFDRIVGVRAGNPAGQALLRFLQRKVLSEVYKLDPAHMARVVEYFGPVDWRSVDAHSLFWGTLAIMKSGETISSFSNDKTNMTRMIFFSLRNLLHRNRIVFEPYARSIPLSYINFSFDANFIEPMQRAYLIYAPMIDPMPGAERIGVGDTFRSGHISFLTEAVRLLYMADRKQEAQHYYNYLRDTYSVNEQGHYNPAFTKTLDEYVLESFYEGIEGPREARLAVNAMLTSAYEELAQGNRRRYNQWAEQARKIYDEFMKAKQDTYSEHHRMPPFSEIQADVLMFYLGQPSVDLVSMLHKVRLWRHLTPALQWPVYDQLIEGLKAETDYYKLDLAKAFPEPEGMAEYREQRARRGPEEKDKGFQTPAQSLN